MLTKTLRAVIIGAPGSGKGTISSRIVDYYSVKHVSSGDLLRLNAVLHTDIGNKAQEYMATGQLVPDEIVVQLIMKELKKHSKVNWLLDGFPRTRLQAETLHAKEPINIAINLIVPFDVIISRIAGRWIHLPSGRVYNTDFNPPKIPGCDDVTGEALVQREDDAPAAVKKRLQVYSETISPVLDYYKESGILTNFKGNESNKIWPEVYERLSKMVKPKKTYP